MWETRQIGGGNCPFRSGMNIWKTELKQTMCEGALSGLQQPELIMGPPKTPHFIGDEVSLNLKETFIKIRCKLYILLCNYEI